MRGAAGGQAELRIILRHARLRTSESKGTSNSLIECGLGSAARISDWLQELCGLLNRHTSVIPRLDLAPQHEALDLAGRGERQLVEHLEAFRQFVNRDLVAQEIGELLE